MSATSPRLCQCGCGQFAAFSDQTRPKAGVRLGDPLRFIHGHNARRAATAETYRGVWVNGKLRPVHLLRAERALGKPLPAGAIVHHADGSRSEHAPLVICQDYAYHQFLHIRMRVQAAGGNPNTEALCRGCREPKPFCEFPKAKSRRLGLEVLCRLCIGRTRAHRRRAVQALGRPLPKGSELHHVDGSHRADASLVICQDRAYHNLLHARTRERARLRAAA